MEYNALRIMFQKIATPCPGDMVTYPGTLWEKLGETREMLAGRSPGSDWGVATGELIFTGLATSNGPMLWCCWHSAVAVVNRAVTATSQINQK